MRTHDTSFKLPFHMALLASLVVLLLAGCDDGTSDTSGDTAAPPVENAPQDGQTPTN